jgi:antitoxin (DNA-binding transcriptional repressor) of toxin-antitoxin stability system
MSSARHVPASVDIDDDPRLLQLTEEVNRSGEPLRLCRDGKPVAVIAPAVLGRSGRRRQLSRSEAMERFRSAAGAWADVDVDKFIADIYASRDAPGRPAVDL